MSIKYKKQIKYFFFFGFVFLFFLVETFPVSVAISRLPIPKHIEVIGISGTIWSGNIKQVRISGVSVGSLRWSILLSRLFFGELAIDASIEKKEGNIKSIVRIFPSGKVELNDTSFNIDLSSVEPSMYGFPVEYKGVVSGVFPKSTFIKNTFLGLNGKVSVDSLTLTYPQYQKFGDFHINFQENKNGSTFIKTKSLNASLKFDAKGLITKLGEVNVKANINASDDITLNNVVALLGEQKASGDVVMEYRAALW